MEPTPSQKKEHILGNAGGFPERLVAEHCRRLDADYFNEFSVTEIEGHLARLATLSRSQPFAFQFSALQDRAFGLTVVGEGVEHEAQLGSLERAGCDFAQGFLFARPQPPSGLASAREGASEPVGPANHLT